ncbi:MAG: acyl carrier protein [Candidatus Cloacimonadota bacterium]|nr:MAG: acyl carrier protein [Candidatus Cloacimonadota bacterium]
MDIKQKVTEIIVEELDVDASEVKPEANFIEDLGADSLDTVELILKFEEEFDLDIPDSDAEKLKSVGDAIKYLESKLDA